MSYSSCKITRKLIVICCNGYSHPFTIKFNNLYSSLRPIVMQFRILITHCHPLSKNRYYQMQSFIFIMKTNCKVFCPELALSVGLSLGQLENMNTVVDTGRIKPLCWWWWPIENDANNPKNDWNPGTWVLIWEYSARAIQWIPAWQGLDFFQIGRVKEFGNQCSHLPIVGYLVHTVATRGGCTCSEFPTPVLFCSCSCHKRGLYMWWIPHPNAI